MADDERRALVVRGPRSLAEVGPGARNILSSVVSDALAVVRSREEALVAPRFRIGSYEFREPDHTQMLRWAKRIDIDLEALVRQLTTYSFTHSESVEFASKEELGLSLRVCPRTSCGIA